MKTVKLRLIVALASSICVSNIEGLRRVFLTHLDQEIELPEEEATLLLNSEHGHVFEVVKVDDENAGLDEVINALKLLSSEELRARYKEVVGAAPHGRLSDEKMIAAIVTVGPVDDENAGLDEAGLASVAGDDKVVDIVQL